MNNAPAPRKRKRLPAPVVAVPPKEDLVQVVIMMALVRKGKIAEA